MARSKLRSRREVVDRVHGLARALRDGLERLPEGEDDPEVIDAVWEAEGLGALLWALGLVELPPFDRLFDRERLVVTPVENAILRPQAEIEQARETARLWHWRARTTSVKAEPGVELPDRWQSFDQLVAATAMRGHERGLLPLPLRGDFPAFGAAYRELLSDQHAEALSIAYERHRALNWLCGAGKRWTETPTDT